MKKEYKTILLLFSLLIISFIGTNDYSAKSTTCYYKKSETEQYELLITENMVKLNDTILRDGADMGENKYGYKTYFFSRTGDFFDFNEFNKTGSFQCPKYLYDFGFVDSFIGEIVNAIWITDESFSEIKKTTFGSRYGLHSEIVHDTYGKYDPVTLPEDGSDPKCNAHLYHQSDRYGEANSKWECSYGDNKGNILTIVGNKDSYSLRNDDKKEVNIKNHMGDIKKPKDCPKDIWIKITSASSKVNETYDVYSTSNEVKSCKITEHRGNVGVDSTVSQICKFVNLKNPEDIKTVKVTTSEIIINNEKVYEDKNSNLGIALHFPGDAKGDINKICDNTYMFYHPSKMTCDLSDSHQTGVVSFSKEPDWAICTSLGLNANKTDDKNYSYIYKKDKDYSWTNPDYIDPNANKGKTEELEIISEDNDGNLTCEDLFGAPDSRNGLYDVIHTARIISQTAIPLILLLFTILDFTKSITSDEALPKAKKNAVVRAIVAVCLVLVPAFLNIIWELMAWTSCMI